MRTRHRIPSIFNLSMVDMMCCSLGCVIIMWLVNLQDTSKQVNAAEEKANSIVVQLSEAERDRERAQKELEKLNAALALMEQEKSRIEGRVADYSRNVTNLQNEKKTLEEQMRDALARLAAMETQLDSSMKTNADARKRTASLEEQLATALANMKDLQGKANLVPEVQKDLKVTREQLAALVIKLAAREKELAAAQAELKKEKDRLAIVLEEKAKLEDQFNKTSTQLTQGMDQARGYKDRWMTAEKKIADLEATLRDREAKISAAIRDYLKAEDEGKILKNQVVRLQADAINRFAGITLTGKRVVFLIDRSGSMLEDARDKPSSAKWAEVRNTVAKLMRSLPALEKFQLVAFAQDATFPLGNAGSWIDYDPEKSPDLVVKALADPALTPNGGTNMYAGLEASFQLRTQGLDTIYLLSDGLPSVGPGVSAELANTIPQDRLGQMLGQHIRRKLDAEWNVKATDGRRVRINSIGFFYESPDVGAFLWSLSRDHGGSFVGMNH